jgi:hypothetical protein
MSDTASTDVTVEFVTQVKKSDKNLPVGVSPVGIQVYGYTDQPGYSDSVLTIPFHSIDEVRVVKETRLRRVITTTGLLILSLAYGCFGCLVGYNLLQGKIVGMGLLFAVFFSITGPLCLIGALISPLTYFTRLGHYLHFRVGRRWMRRYFEPKFWDEHGSQISDLIARNGRSVTLPLN